MGEYVLGTGVLTWEAGERRSDRYGSVFLMPEGQNSLSIDPGEGTDAGRTYIGLTRVDGRGRLIAEVLKTRQSTHIGDLARGLFPITPEVGDRFTLGEGTLWFLEEDWADQVGLTPFDDRENDWLDPTVLYRVHEQTVRLIFEQLHYI